MRRGKFPDRIFLKDHGGNGKISVHRRNPASGRIEERAKTKGFEVTDKERIADDVVHSYKIPGLAEVARAGEKKACGRGPSSR